MNGTLKEAFSKLSINYKRNELNNEMEIAFRMLKDIKYAINAPDDKTDQIKNYHMVYDADMTESEMLDQLYMDFHVIQKNILDLAEKVLFTKDSVKI